MRSTNYNCNYKNLHKKSHDRSNFAFLILINLQIQDGVISVGEGDFTTINNFGTGLSTSLLQPVYNLESLNGNYFKCEWKMINFTLKFENRFGKNVSRRKK